MTLPDFLQRGPLGEVRFAGSRIDLYFVVAAVKEGLSADQIGAQYPTLPLVLIRSAIDYCRGNRAEVDEYVRGVEVEIAHNLATLPHMDGDALRQWLAQRPAEQTANTPAARE